MKRPTPLRLLLIATAVAPILGGCATHENIPPPPPPPVTTVQTAPVVEVRTVSPGPDYIWIDGGYAWNGTVWIWEPGRWECPPRRGMIWIRGGYYYRHGRRYWSRGYWR